MDGKKDGQKDGKKDGQKDGKKDGQKDGKKDGQKDGKTEHIVKDLASAYVFCPRLTEQCVSFYLEGSGSRKGLRKGLRR